MSSDWAPKPKPHPLITERLANPPGAFTLAELPHFWRTVRLTFVYERPHDLEGGPRLPAAFRGALGDPLRQVSEARHGNDPFVPTPFHALYADHGPFEESRHAPKPFVIWCRETANKVFVSISLFGFAADWREDIAEAMFRVMAPVERGGSGGVSIFEAKHFRRSWQLLDYYWQERGQYVCPSSPESFIMVGVTPIRFGNQETARGSYSELFFSLFARIKGLARWQGITITDMDEQGIRRAANAISVLPLGPSAEAAYRRKSRTFGTEEKWQTGTLPILHLSNLPEAMWPAFVLGTLAHIGYDVSQGHGRFVICPPLS